MGLCVCVLSVVRLCKHVTCVITHTQIRLVRFDGYARSVEVEREGWVG